MEKEECCVFLVKHCCNKQASNSVAELTDHPAKCVHKHKNDFDYPEETLVGGRIVEERIAAGCNEVCRLIALQIAEQGILYVGHLSGVA